MAAETQYTANSGMVAISTANANLDGTGTLYTVMTASSGSNPGTLIKTVVIKAQGNTTQGMVRLYVYDGTSVTELLNEVQIPAVTKSATDPSFEIWLDVNYVLKTGYSLKASTQNGETFNVFAFCMDWAYYGSSVRPESTKYTAVTGMQQIATANSNLDGTGTLGTVLTAASNGTNIQSVTIKAIANTTAGMVRLYVYNGTTNFLLTEVPVDAVTKSATAHSFSQRVVFNGSDLPVKSGYLLKASTEKAETFNIIAEATEWSYPA